MRAFWDLQKGYLDLFITKSMTESERMKDYELRQMAKERNREKVFKEWVVYRGEVRRAAELSKSRVLENSQWQMVDWNFFWILEA